MHIQNILTSDVETTTAVSAGRSSVAVKQRSTTSTPTDQQSESTGNRDSAVEARGRKRGRSVMQSATPVDRSVCHESAPTTADARTVVTVTVSNGTVDTDQSGARKRAKVDISSTVSAANAASSATDSGEGCSLALPRMPQASPQVFQHRPTSSPSMESSRSLLESPSPPVSPRASRVSPPFVSDSVSDNDDDGDDEVDNNRVPESIDLTSVSDNDDDDDGDDESDEVEVIEVMDLTSVSDNDDDDDGDDESDEVEVIEVMDLTSVSDNDDDDDGDDECDDDGSNDDGDDECDDDGGNDDGDDECDDDGSNDDGDDEGGGGDPDEEEPYSPQSCWEVTYTKTQKHSLTYTNMHTHTSPLTHTHTHTSHTHTHRSSVWMIHQ